MTDRFGFTTKFNAETGAYDVYSEHGLDTYVLERAVVAGKQ